MAKKSGGFVFSCVIDGPARLQLQAYYPLSSLLDVAGVDAGDVVVHAVADLSSEFRRGLSERGIEIVRVAPFGHPYCNKLQQLSTFTGRRGGHVVLLDCDVFLARPVEWPKPLYAAAKHVDIALPPASMLRTLFEGAGLTPKWTTSDLLSGPEGRETVRNNCNGGVYVLATSFLTVLAEPWRRWAHWCLERAHLIEPFLMHVDQVAFALALAELGVDSEALDRTLNFPTHLALPPDVDCSPAVLHYHRQLDSQLLLRPTSLPGVDAAIAVANERILAWRRERLVPSLFFGARYELFPDLGSGVGSRGDILAHKRSILERLLEEDGGASVLEIGCGDLQVSSGLDVRRYVGVDVASPIIEAARARRPDWSFRVADPVDPTAGCEPVDIVLCLDVLLHQARREGYERLVADLGTLAKRELIVSGYDDTPVFTSSITYFHEPLTTTLERLGDFDEIAVVGGYRDVSVVVARRRRDPSHPRDMAGCDVGVMSHLVDDPLVFCRLLKLARSTVGFFPAHTPRAVEYTWVASSLATGLDGLSVIDVGAGVNPLPFWLARAGAMVTTVDNHQVIRLPADRDSWNEWGFLEYGRIDPRITSHHEAFERLTPAGNHDVLVCISVIEHLPSTLRRTWIRLFTEHLRPGGRLLLTVDLVPWSERLWCFREGTLVEDSATHGTLGDLLEELEDAGFLVQFSRSLKHLPRCRVGVALVEATRPQ